MTDQELPPDISDWLNSQEYIDRYNAYITRRIEDEKQMLEATKVRDKLREEYEASPAYKIELEIKKLKEERSTYIKKFIQPLHNALVDMGATCSTSDCDCCDDSCCDDSWRY